MSTSDTALQSWWVLAMQQIGFFLTPGFPLFALGCAVEPLRVANVIAATNVWRWSFLSSDGAAVSSDTGLSVSAELPAWQASEFLLVLLFTGAATAATVDTGLSETLRDLNRNVPNLGAVGDAVVPLARAGLLSGYRCAVAPQYAESIVRQFPRIELGTYELFCIDRNRLTCVGGTAVMGMMLAYIAEQHSVTIAAEVAEELLHVALHSPGTALEGLLATGRSEALDRRLAGAVTLMKETLMRPVPVHTIASRVGASERELERLFHQAFGCSPSRFYVGLRLNHARRLVVQSNASILDIAYHCGFTDASHLTRWYSRMFHQTPARERRRRHTLSIRSISGLLPESTGRSAHL